MAEMNLMPLGEQENNELLRQAIAVIDKARSSLHPLPNTQMRYFVAVTSWNWAKDSHSLETSTFYHSMAKNIKWICSFSIEVFIG